VDEIRTKLFKKERVIACAATGCHAVGTKILMYNGSLKNVEDICVGDALMGNDSTKRTVDRLIRGRELMYQITPVKGDSFIVNGNHILSLKRTTSDKNSRGREPIMNLSVNDYIKTNKNFKHLYKLYRTGIDFNSYSEKLRTHPYFVGLWLGDGTMANTALTNPDKEVQSWMLNEFQEDCKINHEGVIVKVVKNKDRCDTIFSNVPIGGGRGNHNNSLLNFTRTLISNSEKRIPKDYLINSREVRLQVLAGLLDTDGYRGHGGYEITTKYNGLSDDILFLARSLGLAAYVSKKIGKIKKLNFIGEYFRISISGDCSIIPCKIERKKASVRQQIKSVLTTGFSIQELPEDNFYGFELDGNNLYCMGDFTITHNSGKTKCFIAISNMAISKGKTVLIMSETAKIFSQISKEIENCVNIESKVKTLDVKPTHIYVAMSQTLAKRPNIISKFLELGKDLIIIADECHIGTFTKLIMQFRNSSYIIGFSATPDFRFAKHLPLLYHDIIIGAQPQELVEMGFLAPYYHYERKVVDLKGLKKSSTGDFTEQSQEQAFEKAIVYDGIFEDIVKFKFRKCMIFTASIQHAEDVGQKMRSRGYKVAVCHSKNPESDFELFQFLNLNSGIDICISVASLTKGFDAPSVDNIILLRSTLSLPLYLQMIGRGSRINEFTGKTKFTVIDYGGNATRHGLWNFERDWSSMWSGKQKTKGEGIAPVKTCPNKLPPLNQQCGYMMHTNVMICPDCGFVFEKKKVDAKETELVELNTRYNALRGRKISTLTPSELVDYARSTNKKKYAERIAKSKGMDYLREYGFKMGYKESWVYATHTDEVVEFYDVEIK